MQVIGKDQFSESLIALQGDLAAPFTPVSLEEGRRIVLEQFGISAQLTRFATEKDDTFRCDCSSGQSYVLKIANPQESPIELSLQIEVMQHIGRRAPQLPIPRVYPALDGGYLTTVVTASGESRQVRLLSFLPGTPLDKTTLNAQGREQIGQLLAHLRLATADFAHPAESRQVCWDVQHLRVLEPLLNGVVEPARRHSLERALERFGEVEELIAGCRQQVLHNDFNTSNIVIDAHRPQCVGAIIDFGDTVKTAIAIDVSTAMMNQLLAVHPGQDLDIFAPAKDLLRGYLQVADLTPEELALIPHLAMARLVARALITTWRSQLFPQNSAYILRNAAPGWGQLDWLLNRSPSQMSALLMHFAH
ncbi:phosphotransferase [Pseudomonas syringae]|uniref:Hydroxylysine kinase n=1 Tax=Pseudomonas syringae pv. aptata TaxID=83167 RepID=A0A0Q0DKL4_PSEAP|nr:phosphotransferase [Pseudomonas syringae]KPZ01599.1 putative homoserine kinase type II [Pseudomonas syringae pv. aptata]MDP5166033.1 phosphotransferase [Pseudomonas syringae pv. aptata str. DSM 50252]RMO43357.1 putative homoserine kinase type II [Pseudomonas syringae]RMO66038.1 putative homoserine kinase type II [Pseudomonas syringae pv. aptata]